ncbi:MAG TPA: GIY-YIG nuclease family protein [Chromatiales bacterium]|nr:GIY-YIG nuclease family protein [Kiloniellaceae bacterium]HIP52909.1 GIY-YIG nuclease family protein [Chromatiales bacterium]
MTTETTAQGWTVYMVQCSDGTLYTGITNDLGRRLDQHNNGDGAKYTRARRPVRLVYREEAADKSAALRREIALKRLSSIQKRRLITAGTTT